MQKTAQLMMRHADAEYKLKQKLIQYIADGDIRVQGMIDSVTGNPRISEEGTLFWEAYHFGGGEFSRIGTKESKEVVRTGRALAKLLNSNVALADKGKANRAFGAFQKALVEFFKRDNLPIDTKFRTIF